MSTRPTARSSWSSRTSRRCAASCARRCGSHGYRVVEAATAAEGIAHGRPHRPRRWCCSISACPTATASRSRAQLREWTRDPDHRALGARPGGRQGRGARRRRRRLPDQAVRRRRAAGAHARRAAPRRAPARRRTATVHRRRRRSRIDLARRAGHRRRRRRSTSPRSSTSCSPRWRSTPGGASPTASCSKEVWGPAHADQTHYLRVYMAQLRHKLEADPARPQLPRHRARRRLSPARPSEGGGLPVGQWFGRSRPGTRCVRRDPFHRVATSREPGARGCSACGATPVHASRMSSAS